MRTIDQCLQSRQHNFNFIRLCTSVFVIYSHAIVLTGYPKQPLFVIDGHPFHLSGISVNIFFVISGFLISASFDRSKSLSQYFISRALRIYPALVAVILISALLIGPILTTDSLKSYFTNIEVLKYLTNMAALRIQHSLPGVFANNPFPDFINGSLWTMPLVVLCYTLLAVAGMALRKKFTVAGLILMPVLIYLYFHPHFYQKAQYYDNLFYFLTGAMFYLARKKIIIDYRAAIPMVIVFVAARTFLDGLPYLVVTGVSSAYVVMYISFIKNRYLKEATRYGDFTYGLYIWAFPVQQIFALRFSDWGPYKNFSASLVVSLVLAALSYHLIEKKAFAYKGAFVKKSPPALEPAVPMPAIELPQSQAVPERV